VALPPISFQVPPRQRSVIEEAFGQALATLATQAIGAPFEKRREQRALANELALTKGRAEIDLANLPKRMELDIADWRKRMRESSEQEIQDIPRRLAAKTRGEIDSLGILRGQTVEPATERIIDRVQNLIGGFSAEDIAKPTNLAEFDQVGGLLNTAIAAANVNEERNRTQLQRDSMRDIREANLFPPLSAQDLEEFGAYVNSETGNPLSTLDIQLLKAGVRGQITTAPEFEQYKNRAMELQKLRERGGLVRMPFTQDAYTNMLKLFTGMGAGQTLMIHAQAYPFLLWKKDADSSPEHLDLGNTSEVTGWMASNQDLLDALAASRLNRDMNDVLQAEKTGQAPRLSPRALGYLSLIYHTQGRAYEHPDAQIPEEIPEAVLRELGQTRMRAGSTRRAGADTTGGGATQINRGGSPFDTQSRIGPTYQQGRGALFAGLDISAERRYPEYLELQQGIQTVLRTGPNARRGGLPYDSTTYRTMENDFIQNHATPEKALQFYKSLGVPDAQLRGLFEGDSTSKQLELDTRLRFALGALQNARDAIVAK